MVSKYKPGDVVGGLFVCKYRFGHQAGKCKYGFKFGFSFNFKKRGGMHLGFSLSFGDAAGCIWDLVWICELVAGCNVDSV